MLDFLDNNRCGTLYLVGDIIDLQRMRSRFYWPKSHTEALQRFLEMARAGTRVIYVPGNHDGDFRAMAESFLGPVEVTRQLVHATADERRLLVLHGDEFDSTLKCGPLAFLIGSAGYGLLLGLNRISDRINALCGLPYWPLAQAEDAHRQGVEVRCPFSGRLPAGCPRRRRRWRRLWPHSSHRARRMRRNRYAVRAASRPCGISR